MSSNSIRVIEMYGSPEEGFAAKRTADGTPSIAEVPADSPDAGPKATGQTYAKAVELAEQAGVRMMTPEEYISNVNIDEILRGFRASLRVPPDEKPKGTR